MWRILFGKYKEIVAAIAVFVVLDAGVLLLNFYTTYEISDDASAIRLASRQAELTQRVFYSVTQVREDLMNYRNFEKHQTDLSVSYKQFDEALDAFIYGGDLIGQGQGQDDLLVDDTYKALSDQYLLEAEKIWKPYRLLVSALVYAEYYDEDLDEVTLIKKADAAIDYARDNGDTLLKIVTEFATAVEQKAHKKAERLRMVQAIAITLAVINFFVILFHFIKRLNSSDEKVKEAQDETAEILRTVNDGLFLLDADYKIGSQYSASMEMLFRQEQFAGTPFLQLLAPLVSGDTLGTAQDYIDSLFNERVKSYLMDELNPLQEVEITVDSKHGESVHFFSFEFTRVYQGGKIIHLLVSVKDVTENIELQRKLRLSEDKVNEEVESLLALMRIDGGLLREFLNLLDGYLMAINDELEKPAYHTAAFEKKLDKISRLAHTLKGEASMLNLGLIESRIHVLEDKLGELKEKMNLEGDDFLPVAIELNGLVKAAESIRLVSSRFPETTDTSTTGASALQAALESLAEKVSQSHRRQVRLDFSQFNESLIPSESMPVVKNVLIQLIRNAIVHGLEKPEKRQKLGKNPVGRIAVIVEEVDDMLMIRVNDDGRGIDFKSIRKYLVEKGQYSHEQVEALKPKELVKFIFKPGFSTAKNVDNHAGRGVGLDVVKELLDEMGAYLSVSCKSKKSSEFRIRIPLKERVAQLA